MIKQQGIFKVIVATILIGMIPILAGCATPGPNTTREIPSDHRTAADFTGPWAAEFADAYNTATDDFTREVLADGVVTDAERSEMLARFTSCLNAGGVWLTSEYRFDGSYNFTFDHSMDSDKANSVENDCSRSSGEYLIGALYSSTHRNPDHADIEQLIAECLTKNGVAPDGYSAANYRENRKSDKYPFPNEKTGREILESCRVDPLSLQEQ